MSPTVVDRRIEWTGVRDAAVYSRTVELQPWTGERVDVVVDPDAVALVADDDGIRGVLLTGTHAVHVLRPGEEPGDVDPREFAARMRTEIEDAKWLRPRTRHLPSASRLTFVTVGALVYVEFGGNGPVLFRDARRGDVPLEIQGVARLAVTDPVAFHASFLAGTEDLRVEDFERIAGALIEAGLGEALRSETGDVEAIEPDPASLADQARPALRPQLAALGLDVEAIEITRLETPGSSAPAPTADPAPLATSDDRG